VAVDGPIMDGRRPSESNAAGIASPEVAKMRRRVAERFRPRLIIAFTASFGVLMGSSNAVAQAAPACPPAPITLRFAKCALWIDESGAIRRGQGAELIATGSLFRPIALERIVEGDSARFYARRYQSSIHRARAFQIGGVAISVASLIIAQQKRVGILQLPPSRDQATSNSPVLLATFLSGLIASSGFHYPRSARSAKARAVWWHNERLLR
jgi:hypothetical protein